MALAGGVLVRGLRATRFLLLLAGAWPIRGRFVAFPISRLARILRSMLDLHDAPPRRPSILHVARPSVRGDRHDLARERDSISRALIYGSHRPRVAFDFVEAWSLGDLQRALLVGHRDVIGYSGHGIDLGFVKNIAGRRRHRYAEALAELTAASCRPNASVLLMGCGTRALAPSFVARGLTGVCWDGLVDGGAIAAFLEGYFIAFCVGRRGRAAFDDGCRAIAFEYPEALAAIRWFAPGQVVEHERYEWLRSPEPQLGGEGARR